MTKSKKKETPKIDWEEIEREVSRDAEDFVQNNSPIKVVEKLVQLTMNELREAYRKAGVR